MLSASEAFENYLAEFEDRLHYPDNDSAYGYDEMQVQYLPGKVSIYQHWACGDGCCSDSVKVEYDLNELEQQLDCAIKYDRMTVEQVEQIKQLCR